MWNTTLKGTGYIVEDTSNHIEDKFADYKPDMVLKHEEIGEDAWRVEIQKLPAIEDGKERAKHAARVALAWNTSIVEVKLKPVDDPFGQGTDVGWSKGYLNAILKYVIEMFLREHRECVYMAFIAGSRARLMRWDRCGVVVTEAFDYIKDPTDLVNFFCFLATSSREVQGFDTFMAPATKGQDDEGTGS